MKDLDQSDVQADAERLEDEFEDMKDEAYRANEEWDLRAKVEEVLKEYVEESTHEGTPMSAADFAIYLNEQFER
jgi:hypothetical protein